MFDLQSLDDLSLLAESVDLECKLAQGQDGKGEVPKDFWPTYSAMANMSDGVVVLGERAGSGLPKISAGWEAEGQVMRLSDTVEPFDQTLLKMDWTASANSTDVPGIRSPISSPIDLLSTEEKILRQLRGNPRCSTQQLGDALGISKRAVLKQVEKLKQQGRLARIGSAKGGYWQVLE